MPLSAGFTDADRAMSVKAALLGGICAGGVSLGLLVVHRVLIAGMDWVGMFTVTALVNGAIASISGAMFALTYRYAVRQDNNVQLKAGVVLAFTLVRGLAQVDAESAISQHFWPFLTTCSESFLMFGVTALLLTLASQQKWMQ